MDPLVKLLCVQDLALMTPKSAHEETAELATAFLFENVWNVHTFLNDWTKLSYQVIKPTVHSHDWRPAENIRPWNHGKFDRWSMHCFQIYRTSTPCHHAAAFPAFPAFPAFQPKMMKHDADIGAVSVAEQKRPRQWGSMRTGNTWVEVFICVVFISRNRKKRKHSQIKFLLEIKEIRTSFVSFLAESTLWWNSVFCNSFNLLSPNLVRLESARLKWKPRITLPATAQFVTLSDSSSHVGRMDDTQRWRRKTS